MVDLLTLVIALVAVAFGLGVGFYVGRVMTERTMEMEFREREREVRRDSVGRSRATLSGQVLEKLAPHFPEFPYDPTDLRFIGTPVDYIVFDGLGAGDVQGIVFLEVKSGGSTLTTRERRVRDAVEAGAVRWDVYRVPEER
jgi:predicted Holliday junction resolvase-like endonuclease